MPKVVDHDLRRKEIIQAAWVVIERDGLQKLRLSDIAKEAGFTTGVLPTYFRDRRELLNAAFAMAADRLFERIEGRNAAAKTAVERIFGALEEMLPQPSAPETMAMVIMCFAAREEGGGFISGVFREKNDRYVNLLKAYVAEAIEAGEIDIAVPIDAVVSVIGMALDGLCFNAMALPDRVDSTYCRKTLEAIIAATLARAGALSPELSPANE